MRAARLLTYLAAFLVGCPEFARGDDASIGGTLRVWHPIELTFRGPVASETDDRPNPFLDDRLQVAFTGPDRTVFNVPGFFDGDGKGGERGSCWRVRFTPNRPGRWRYSASFRTGPGVAVDLDPAAGMPGGCDGVSGEFTVAPRDETAPGFLKWGRLSYAGGYYLKFQDGPFWIKGGTDEPENLLAYAGFDNTPASHRFAAHVEDWRPGDPDWEGGKGRGLIGALNYLAAQHVNSIYFLTMNLGGDGRDVWPWSGSPDRKGSSKNDNLHYDVSKLGQWNVVFEHAQRKGIALHFVFNEAEAANKRELDQGELGPERKLFYREMIARFGHHLALEWNLCEEYNLDFNLGADRIRAFADYIRAVDPYDHPITVHSAGDPVAELRFTFGDPRFEMTSVQLNQRPIEQVARAIRDATRRAGRPLPVSLDEFTVDRGQSASHVPVDDAEGHRREKIWPAYFAGGQLEFILQDMLKTDSFKTPEREKLWRWLWYARRFLEQLPFWEMEPLENRIEGGGTITVGSGRGRTRRLGPQVFAKRGEVYAVYLPTGSPSGTLDLSDLDRDAEMRWYNPRTGLFEGTTRHGPGGKRWELGLPPADPEQDWVVLIRGVGSSVCSGRAFSRCPLGKARSRRGRTGCEQAGLVCRAAQGRRLYCPRRLSGQRVGACRRPWRLGVRGKACSEHLAPARGPGGTSRERRFPRQASRLASVGEGCFDHLSPPGEHGQRIRAR